MYEPRPRDRRRSVVRLLVAGSALAALAGCPRAPESIPPEPRLTAAEALARVVERRDAVQGLRGVVETRIDGEGSFSVDMALAVARPAQIRAEVSGLLAPSMLVALDDDRLTAYDGGRGLFVEGRFPEDAARARLPIPPLPTARLVDYFLGTPVPPDRGAELRVPDGADDAVRFDVAWGAPDGDRVVTIRRDLGVPVRLEQRGRDGRPVMVVRWSWQQADVPFAADVSFPGEGFGLRIRWQDPERNPDLDAALFTLPPPPGVQRGGLRTLPPEMDPWR